MAMYRGSDSNNLACHKRDLAAAQKSLADAKKIVPAGPAAAAVETNKKGAIIKAEQAIAYHHKDD
jgi:hypothetical protein